MEVRNKVRIELAHREMIPDGVIFTYGCTLTYNGFSKSYASHPDIDEFWNEYDSHYKFDIDSEWSEVVEFMRNNLIDLYHTDSSLKRFGVALPTLKNFRSGYPVRDDVIFKMIRELRYEVRLEFVDGTIYSDAKDIYGIVRSHVKDSPYEIHKRTGIAITQIQHFINGGTLPVIKMGKIVNFSIKL